MGVDSTDKVLYCDVSFIDSLTLCRNKLISGLSLPEGYFPENSALDVSNE